MKSTKERVEEARDLALMQQFHASYAARKGMTEDESLQAWMAVQDIYTLSDRQEFVDFVTAYNNPMPAEEPTVGRIESGEYLFYRNRTHSVFGQQSSGKSMFMQRIVADELEHGNHVVWIDTEEPNERSMVERLHAMQLSDEFVGNLSVIYPDRRMSIDTINMIVDRITQTNASLVVIDSYGELLALHGKNENVDEDVWSGNAMMRKFAAAGAAVVAIDHPSTTSHWRPAGSKRKLAGVTGAAYAFNPKWDETDIESHSFSKTREGYSVLYCAKDRHGTFGNFQHVCTMKVTPGTVLNVDLNPPRGEDDQPLNSDEFSEIGVERMQQAASGKMDMQLLDQITTLMGTDKGVQPTYIKSIIGGTRKNVDRLLQLGVECGMWTYSKAHNGFMLLEQGTATETNSSHTESFRR